MGLSFPQIFCIIQEVNYSCKYIGVFCLQFPDFI